MSVFNSLGSNYTRGFIYRSLNVLFGMDFRPMLLQKLENYYEGQGVLTYKGRHALELACLQSRLPKGSKIGINGFSCFVVYDAVVRAGYQPVFIDIAKGTPNFGRNELDEANKDGKIKAIIVQNTLGMVTNMTDIQEYCKSKKVLIIEDLAHSLGAVYDDGREAGMVGFAVMLSFSQDKPLDAVAGGAMIVHMDVPLEHNLAQAGAGLRFKNRFYPLSSSLIRGLYPIGLGRYLHAGLKKMKLLATPMGDKFKVPMAMTKRSAYLLNSLWDGRQATMTHRREMAEIYKQMLPPEICLREVLGTKSAYLRFPIVVENREAVVAKLKKSNIYVGDTWYDAPVGPKRYMKETSYTDGDCPNAEVLASRIVNLPTHINVSPKEAHRIADEVLQCLK